MKKHLINLALAVFILVIMTISAVYASGKQTAPVKLKLVDLISRLSSANHDAVRDLPPVQCDYRVDAIGANLIEKDKMGTHISGKLTVLQDPRLDYPSHTGFYGYHFDSCRIDIDSWPALVMVWSMSAQSPGTDPKEMKQMQSKYRFPGTKLVYSTKGSWLISPDDKSAMEFHLDSIGETLVFWVINPLLCYHYAALGLTLDGDKLDSVVGTRNWTGMLAGHESAEYVFHLPKKKQVMPEDPDPDTYTVWLDESTGLPLKEEFSYQGKITSSVTFQDYVSFGSNHYGPKKRVSLGSELDSLPFESKWFLTNEIRLKDDKSGMIVGKMSFSNWRRAKIGANTFSLPNGVKMD